MKLQENTFGIDLIHTFTILIIFSNNKNKMNKQINVFIIIYK